MVASIEQMSPYRDPRTAFGGASTSRPRVPVGQVIDGLPPTSAAVDLEKAATTAPKAMQAARSPVLGAVGRAAGVAAIAAPEALDIGRVLANPSTSGADVAAQTAEGVGRFASAGAGAIGGAQLGAMAAPFLGPFGIAAPAVGGLVGGAVGYFAGDRAIKGGRELAGVDPRSPVDRMPAAQPVAAQPVAASRQQPLPVGTTGNGGIAEPAAIDQAPNPAGVIQRSGNAYSGQNIKFGTDIASPRNPGVEVTSLDNSDGLRQNQMELVRLQSAAAIPAPAFGFGGEQIGMARTGGTDNFGRSLSVLAPDGEKPRDRRHAASLANARELADVAQAGETGRAMMRERSQADIAALSSDTQRQTNAQNNGTSRRGQDIGATTAGYSADESAAARRDVAAESRAGRVEAATERASMPKVVGGGSRLEIAPDGTYHVVQDPARMVHPVTGEEIGAKPAKQGLQATAARIAIRDDPKMTREQKIAKLKEIDAQGSR